MPDDPQTHGMNVYRSMLEDEGAHLEDAVRTGIAAALQEAQRQMRDDPTTIYREHETLRRAIVAHRERWTSVNSGDIQLNARPADLELWEVLND